MSEYLCISISDCQIIIYMNKDKKIERLEQKLAKAMEENKKLKTSTEFDLVHVGVKWMSDNGEPEIFAACEADVIRCFRLLTVRTR